MGVDPKSCSLFHVPFPLTERLRAQGEKEHSHWWNGSLLHMLVQSNSFDHNYSNSALQCFAWCLKRFYVERLQHVF